MHIIAIAWIYVVSMMALTEKSAVAGIMTFCFYCAIPLGLVWFIFKRKKPAHAITIKTAQVKESNSQPDHADTDGALR